MNDKEKILKDYQCFKANYEFNQKELQEIDGKIYCDGMSLLDENGEEISECEKWINVGYSYHGSYSKVLSNLYPYEFEFRGKKLSSIESFFQGIKFKNIEMQNYVFSYSGKDAVHVKACSEYDWKKTGIIYWQGEEIDRFSTKYDDLVDELYISAIQNPLYRSALKICNKDIIHTIGKDAKEETTYTRYEFEKQLNCLKDFLKDYNYNKSLIRNI